MVKLKGLGRSNIWWLHEAHIRCAALIVILANFTSVAASTSLVPSIRRDEADSSNLSSGSDRERNYQILVHGVDREAREMAYFRVNGLNKKQKVTFPISSHIRPSTIALSLFSFICDYEAPQFPKNTSPLSFLPSFQPVTDQSIMCLHQAYIRSGLLLYWVLILCSVCGILIV